MLRYRAQANKKSDDELYVWNEDFAELVSECGFGRVETGMRKAWTRRSFLPTAAEVRELLPDAPREAPPPYDPHCPDCQGSGWKSVMRYSDLYHYEERAVSRCDCNRRPIRKGPQRVEVIDVVDLKQKLAQTAAACKMPPTPARVRPQEIRPTIPAVQFTAEQIAARKDIERAECYSAMVDQE